MRWALVVALLVAPLAFAGVYPIESGSSARALTGAPSAPAVAGVEARAVELDGTGNLICAERLEDDGLNSIPNGHDFADSPDAYECAVYDTNSSLVHTIAESGMPAGNTVDRVLEIQEDASSINWIEIPSAASVGPEIRRFSIRFYLHADTDFSGTGDNGINCPSERNKIVQFGFASSNIQLQESTFTSGCHGPGTANPTLEWVLSNNISENAYPQNGSSEFVTFDDCRTGVGWCRVEVVVMGNVAAGTSITTEVRVKTLSDGDVFSASITTPRTMGALGTNQIGADLFHGQGQGGIGGWRVSNFLAAKWPTDAGQFIGCAPEVEGEGCL